MSRYTDLITSEHADKPKFVATVALLTEPMITNQALRASLAAAMDIDNAVGDQLDIIGEWVGRSRVIKTPLVGIYFALDTVGVGLDEGYWKRPFDPTEGLTSLLDDSYRLFLKAVIALNYWDGTVPSANAAIDPLFPNNFIYVQDNFDMSLTIVVGGPVLDVISAALLTGGYLALKAATVRINYAFTSTPPDPVFGLDADNNFIGGLDHGAWGQATPA